MPSEKKNLGDQLLPLMMFVKVDFTFSARLPMQRRHFLRPFLPMRLRRICLLLCRTREERHLISHHESLYLTSPFSSCNVFTQAV